MTEVTVIIVMRFQQKNAVKYMNSSDLVQNFLKKYYIRLPT